MDKIAQRSLRLEWKVCPDGYGVRTRPEPEAQAGAALLSGVASGGAFIVPRTDRLVSTTLEGPNPKQPLMLALVNTELENDRLAAALRFSDRFGLPIDHAKAPVEWLERKVPSFQTAAIIALCHGSREVVKWLGKPPHVQEDADTDGAIYRRPRHLYAFVWAEFLTLVDAGREFNFCDQCDRIFVSAFKRGKRKDEFRFCPGRTCKTAFYNSKAGMVRKAELEERDRRVAVNLKRLEADAAALRRVLPRGEDRLDGLG